MDNETVVYVSVALEIFAIIVTALLLLCSIVTQNTHDKRNKIFLAMLIVNEAALVCDLITWLFERERYTALLYTANFFVFSLGYVMTALFTSYLAACISADKQGKLKNYVRLIYINSAIAVIPVIISLFNGIYFYVDNGRLVSGKYGWISVLYSFIMILSDMLLMLKFRKKLGTKNTVAFLSYGVFPIIAFVIQIIGTELTVTWLASTVTMLLIYLMVHIEYVRNLDRQRAELSENRLKLSKAETALMISQIQPHFLYNSLTVIDCLIKSNPELARKALADFSTYLRCNLNSLKHDGLIMFRDELKHTRAYLSLEKMRFGEYLNVVYDIDEDGFMIPALSVQPLVENAVQHGLADKKGGGTVTISAKKLSDCYEITVTDDGVGFVSGEQKGGGEHIGIDNIRTRLKLMCGGELSVQSAAGRGTRAVVTIKK